MKFDYIEAGNMAGASKLLKQYKDKAVPIAGGTDLLVQMKQKTKSVEYVIGIDRIKELEGVAYQDGLLRIGAATTLRSIETSVDLKSRHPVIPETAKQMASVAVRNVGTIGGNLCNAAPSADMAPPLLVLSARARIASDSGEREVPIEEFFTGPGKTVLGTGEILKEILVPLLSSNSGAAYYKYGLRGPEDLAIVGVAAMVVLDDKGNVVKDIKIGLGAVAPTPIRARVAERLLLGRSPDEELVKRAGDAAAEEAKPITDVRGSAEYRREMVKVFTRYAVKEAVTKARKNLEGRQQ
jgi:carbon-monoxide dehydrogenase medium subunit